MHHYQMTKMQQFEDTCVLLVPTKALHCHRAGQECIDSQVSPTFPTSSLNVATKSSKPCGAEEMRPIDTKSAASDLFAIDPDRTLSRMLFRGVQFGLARGGWGAVDVDTEREWRLAPLSEMLPSVLPTLSCTGPRPRPRAFRGSKLPPRSR